GAGVDALARAEAGLLEVLDLGVARRLAPDGAHDDRADREALLGRDDADLPRTGGLVLRQCERHPVPLRRLLRAAVLRVPFPERERGRLCRQNVVASRLARPGVGAGQLA